MYLIDYHTHTQCSLDSQAPLTAMAAAAAQAGVAELCTTDHCDLQQEDGSLLPSWDWAPILRQYEKARLQCPPGLTLLLGLELGGGHAAPQQAQEILSGAPLDYVLGSVHNLSPAAGGRDLFYLDFSRESVCRRTLDDYYASLLALATLPCYDALGHITYPLRYINGRSHHHFSMAPWRDALDQVLKQVIQTGRAIELNTHCGRAVGQWRPILKRYRALGGEYITLGSDAHRPSDVAKGLNQGANLLRETGFRYLSTYRQRRPEQIPL